MDPPWVTRWAVSVRVSTRICLAAVCSMHLCPATNIAWRAQKAVRAHYNTLACLCPHQARSESPCFSRVLSMTVE